MVRFSVAASVLLVVALVLGAAPAAHAAESYDNCTGFITSLPATIATQGTWCLKSNLTASFVSGNAISVNVSNVTIDCNGFRIVANPGGGNTSTGNGIYSGGHLNITIRNCDIRSFQNGVLLTGSVGGGHLVEDNRLDGNKWFGISVSGDGSVVRRNWVFNTGVSLPGPSGGPVGIVTYNSADISDNTVDFVAAAAGSGQAGTGIAGNINTGGSISGNRVRRVYGNGSSPISYGILADGSIVLRNNQVVGDGDPGSFGFECHNNNSHIMGNVINGFGTAQSNCSDDGGNVIAP